MLTFWIFFVFFFLIAFGAVMGIIRGIVSQSIKTGIVVFSFALSFLLTHLLSGALLSFCENNGTESLLSFISGTLGGMNAEAVIENAPSDILSYIFAIPLGLVILPLFFVIFFLLFKWIFSIVHILIVRLTSIKDIDKTARSRTWGGIVGGMQGLLVAIVLCMPVSGVLTTVNDAAANIEEDYEDAEECEDILSFYNESISPYSKSPAVRFLGAIGGNVIYHSFSTVDIDGKSYDEANIIAEPVIKLLGGADGLTDFEWKTPTGDNKDSLVFAVEAIDDNEYLCHIVVGLLSTAEAVYKDGGIHVDGDDLIIEVVDALFTTLGNVTEDSFKHDLDTILDAYYILGRTDTLNAFASGEEEAVRDKLIADYVKDARDPHTPCDDSQENITVLKKVIEILNSNEHTRPLVTALSKISISILADSTGIDVPIDDLYENVKNGLSDTIAIEKDGKTEEEYVSEVADSIDQTLKANNINVAGEIVDGMAQYVSDNYEELTSNLDSDGNRQVTDEEINKIILSYYEAYLEASKN